MNSSILSASSDNQSYITPLCNPFINTICVIAISDAQLAPTRRLFTTDNRHCHTPFAKNVFLTPLLLPALLRLSFFAYVRLSRNINCSKVARFSGVIFCKVSIFFSFQLRYAKHPAELTYCERNSYPLLLIVKYRLVAVSIIGANHGMQNYLKIFYAKNWYLDNPMYLRLAKIFLYWVVVRCLRPPIPAIYSIKTLKHNIVRCYLFFVLCRLGFG